MKTFGHLHEDLQPFSDVLDYWSKLSPRASDVYEALRKLISINAEPTWNIMYQELYDRAKSLIGRSSCFFFSIYKNLFLETDTSRFTLDAGLLQICDSMCENSHDIPDNNFLGPLQLLVKILLPMKLGIEIFKGKP